MYLDALEFLEEERDAWTPYEALAALDDATLARPVAAAHDWSGRDLMAHLLAWQEVALRSRPSSPSTRRARRSPASTPTGRHAAATS